MERMKKLEELVELLLVRQNWYNNDLFDSFSERDKKLEQRTNEINELAKSLDIFYVGNVFRKVNLTCQFSSLHSLTAFGLELMTDNTNDAIYNSCVVEVANMSVKLLHIELIEEHKKTQTI